MQTETHSKADIVINGVGRSFELFFFEEGDNEGIAFRSTRLGFAAMRHIDFGNDIGLAITVYKAAIRDFVEDMTNIT